MRAAKVRRVEGRDCWTRGGVAVRGEGCYGTTLTDGPPAYIFSAPCNVLIDADTPIDVHQNVDLAADDMARDSRYNHSTQFSEGGTFNSQWVSAVNVVSSDTGESWMSGEGLRVFVSVCECLRGCARVCEGVRGIASVCECLRVFASVCECLRGFARVCLGLVFPSSTPFNYPPPSPLLPPWYDSNRRPSRINNFSPLQCSHRRGYPHRRAPER